MQCVIDKKLCAINTNSRFVKAPKPRPKLMLRRLFFRAKLCEFHSSEWECSFTAESWNESGHTHNVYVFVKWSWTPHKLLNEFQSWMVLWGFNSTRKSRIYAANCWKKYELDSNGISNTIFTPNDRIEKLADALLNAI